MTSTTLRILGFLLLGIAFVGVFLPLLPTTPFVLLATACFARSSEKWHLWMLNNATFGPMIRNWERQRCIGYRVKVTAISSMLLVGGTSVFYFLEKTPMRITGLVLIVIGLITVSSIKTCETWVEDEKPKPGLAE